MAAQARTLSDVADRCLRALSPYDCRRHAALIAARGEASAPVDGRPQDLFHRLRPEQRRGVEAGIADRRRAVERGRELEPHGVTAPAFATKAQRSARGEDWFRDYERARKAHRRAHVRSAARAGGRIERSAQPPVEPRDFA